MLWNKITFKIYLEKNGLNKREERFTVQIEAYINFISNQLVEFQIPAQSKNVFFPQKDFKFLN